MSAFPLISLLQTFFHTCLRSAKKATVVLSQYVKFSRCSTTFTLYYKRIILIKCFTFHQSPPFMYRQSMKSLEKYIVLYLFLLDLMDMSLVIGYIFNLSQFTKQSNLLLHHICTYKIDTVTNFVVFSP